MASAKYSRIDSRKSSSSASSSSCCSTLMIVAFTGLCLVGIWIMSSSPIKVAPVQNSDESSGTMMKNDVSAMTKLVHRKGNINSTSESSNNPPGDNEDDSNEFEDDMEDDINNQNDKQNSSDDILEEERPMYEEEENKKESEDNANNSSENKPQEGSDQTTRDGKKGNDQLIQPEQNRNDGNLNQDGSGQNVNNLNQVASGQKSDEQLNQAGSIQENDEQSFNQASSIQKDNEQSLNQAGSVQNNEQSLNQASSVQKNNDNSLNEAGSVQKNDEQSLNQPGFGQKNDKQSLNQPGGSGERNNEVLNQAGGSGEKTVEKLSQAGPGDQNLKKENNNGVNDQVVYPSGAETGLLKETTTQNGSFSTQAQESKNEKDAKQGSSSGGAVDISPVYNWKLCKTSAWADYIPCLDNLEAIKQLSTNIHYEHRERHCPANPPTCLVPLPEGYKRSIEWPTSRDKIWYHNVPHTQLIEYKGDQHWVQISGEYLIFPGGGTQFKNGAPHYIDFIQQSVPEIAWGTHTRVILDVGCGVASFGGYLFDKDVLTMSVAPKDEHEAQVQFALERGIPAMSAVMGTKRLPFPGNVFDIVHCARCRVPWHLDGGKLLLELNRLLRPGGFFVWSATPVYLKEGEDIQIWEAMKALTKSMCWELMKISNHKRDGIGIAFYRKPVNNHCYEQRQQNEPPPLCAPADDPNAAWNVSLQACMHKVPVAPTERGSQWPEQWPARLDKSPYWLPTTYQIGVYGNTAEQDFATDIQLWNNVIQQSYLNGIGIDWTNVRNVMDMRAIYAGFAAALRDMKIWVMNVVTIDDPDTLPIIYERGLIGVYHNWCESFNTYPRSYDLLHANHLFSIIRNRCNYMAFIAEVDRLLRPEGNLIVRDTVEIINELETILKSMQWEIRMTYSQDKEGLLCAHKTMWRPTDLEILNYAIN